MKQVWCSLLTMTICGTALAGSYTGQVTSVYASTSGSIAVSFTAMPTGTCSNYGWHLVFDGSTASGKNMFASLVSAKALAAAVRVWFTDSSVPGTDETNGCDDPAMAVLTGVAVD